jgi:hypothetical protein
MTKAAGAVGAGRAVSRRWLGEELSECLGDPPSALLVHAVNRLYGQRRGITT